MESRVETLLNALVNGETIDFNPQSRMEEYLKNCINKSGTEGLPAPQSRVDALLYKLAEAIASGGGGDSTPTTPTDNRTSMAYWYQYLYPTLFSEYGDFVEATFTIDELAYPIGTQNISSFSRLTSINGAFSDPEAGRTDYRDFGVPVKKFTGMLDASSATDLSAVFADCKHLTDIGNLKIGPSVASCKRMFYSCTSLETVPTFDTASCMDFNNMFFNCTSLKTVPAFDTANGVDFGYMFEYCFLLPQIPMLNMAKGKNFYHMFAHCTALTSIPDLDLPLATDVRGMFQFNQYNPSAIASAGKISIGKHASNVQGNSLFNYCEGLKSISEINLYNITNANAMFYRCKSLESISGTLEFSQVTNIQTMCYMCEKLVSMPELDLRSMTSAGSAFGFTYNMTNLRLKNLKNNILIGSGMSYGHLIVVEDLIFMIYHLRNAGAARTFTIGSANLEKLANVYVKTINITDEMRAEDDLIDEKLPFEVCASTDEGAMLIKDYVSLKNWTIK